MRQQIQIDLLFKSNTGNTQADLQKLSNSLNALSNIKTPFAGGQMQKASQEVRMLTAELNKAVNVNTGKLDFNKLNSSLKASGRTLADYSKTLLSMGPQGQQAFLQLSRAIASSEIPMISLGKRMSGLLYTFGQTAKWQAVNMVIRSITSSFREAVNYVEDLNKNLTDIRIVSELSAEHMEKFAEKANKAARALAVSTNEYAKASLIFFQQGDNEKLAMEKAETTIKLAKITGNSMEEVSSQLTAVWNNFTDGSQALEYYADVLAKLGAVTASSSEEITEGMQKFAAVAETVGLSYEYAASALATITAQTRQSADIVGTALKTLLARIQSLSLGDTLEDGTNLTKYTEALAKVGVSVKDVNGDLKSANQIFDETAQVWNNLSRAQQNALAQTVAGVRQYTQFVALMDNYDTFKMNVEIAEGAEGTIADQFAIYQESIEAKQEELGASAEKIYSKIFSEDTLKEFFDTLTNITDVVGNFIGMFDKIGGIKTLILGLAGTFSTILFPMIQKGMLATQNTMMSLLGLTQKQKIQNLSAMADQAELQAQTAITESERLQYQYTAETLRAKMELAKLEGSISTETYEALNAEIERKDAMNQQVVAAKQLAEIQAKEYNKTAKTIVSSGQGTAQDRNVAEKATTAFIDTTKGLKTTEDFKQARSTYTTKAQQDYLNTAEELQKKKNHLENLKNTNPMKTKRDHQKDLDLTEKEINNLSKKLDGLVPEVQNQTRQIARDARTTLVTRDIEDNEGISNVGIAENDKNVIAKYKTLLSNSNLVKNNGFSVGEYGNLNTTSDITINQSTIDTTWEDMAKFENGAKNAKLAVEELNVVKNKFKNEDLGIEEKRKSLETFKTTLIENKEAFNFTETDLDEFVQKLNELSKKGDLADKDLDELTQSLMEYSNAQGAAAKKTGEMGEAMANAYLDKNNPSGNIDRNKFINDGMTVARNKQEPTVNFNKEPIIDPNVQKAGLEQFTSGVTSAVSAVSSLTMGVMQFISIMDVWQNEDLTIGEKLKQTFMTAVFALPSLLSGVTMATKAFRTLRAEEMKTAIATKLNELAQKNNTVETGKNSLAQLFNSISRRKNSKATKEQTASTNKNTGALSAEAKKMLGKWGVAAAVIAAVIAIGTTVYKVGRSLYDKASTEAKNAAQAAKKLADAYKEVNEEYKNMVSIMDNYKNGKKGLDELTKGTLEYKEAILEANQQAIELLKHNKQMKYTIDENGLINISDSSLDALQEEELTKVRQAQAASLAAETQAKVEKNEADITKFNRDKAKGSEWSASQDDGNKVLQGLGIGIAVVGTIAALAGALYTGGATTAAIPAIWGAVGAGVGGAAGAALGATAGPEETREEQRVFNKMIEDFAIKGNSMFATKDEFKNYLINEVDLKDEGLIDSLVKNKDEVQKLVEQTHLNTLETKRNNEIVGKQLVEDKFSDSTRKEALLEAAGGIYASADYNSTYEQYVKLAGYRNIFYTESEQSKKAIKKYAEALGISEDDIDVTNAKGGGILSVRIREDGKWGESEDLTAQQIASVIAAYESEGKSKENMQKAEDYFMTKTNEDAYAIALALNDNISNITQEQIDYLNKIKEEIKEQNFVGLDIEKFIENAQESLDEAFKNTTKNLWEPVKKDYTDFYNSIKDTTNLTAAEIKQLGELFNSVYETSGTVGLGELTKTLEQAGEEADEFAVALTNLDWSKIISEDGLIKALEDMGIETDNLADIIDDKFIKAMRNANDAIEEFTGKALVEMDTIIKEAAKNGKLTTEQYDALNKDLQEYFVDMKDGTYALTISGEDFAEKGNQVINTLVEEKKQEVETNKNNLEKFGTMEQDLEYEVKTSEKEIVSDIAEQILSGDQGTFKYDITEEGHAQKNEELAFLQQLVDMGLLVEDDSGNSDGLTEHETKYKYKYGDNEIEIGSSTLSGKNTEFTFKGSTEQTKEAYAALLEEYNKKYVDIGQYAKETLLPETEEFKSAMEAQQEYLQTPEVINAIQSGSFGSWTSTDEVQEYIRIIDKLLKNEDLSKEEYDNFIKYNSRFNQTEGVSDDLKNTYDQSIKDYKDVQEGLAAKAQNTAELNEMWKSNQITDYEIYSKYYDALKLQEKLNEGKKKTYLDVDRYYEVEKKIEKIQQRRNKLEREYINDKMGMYDAEIEALKEEQELQLERLKTAESYVSFDQKKLSDWAFKNLGIKVQYDEETGAISNYSAIEAAYNKAYNANLNNEDKIKELDKFKELTGKLDESLQARDDADNAAYQAFLDQQNINLEKIEHQIEKREKAYELWNKKQEILIEQLVRDGSSESDLGSLYLERINENYDNYMAAGEDWENIKQQMQNGEISVEDGYAQLEAALDSQIKAYNDVLGDFDKIGELITEVIKDFGDKYNEAVEKLSISQTRLDTMAKVMKASGYEVAYSKELMDISRANQQAGVTSVGMAKAYWEGQQRNLQALEDEYNKSREGKSESDELTETEKLLKKQIEEQRKTVQQAEKDFLSTWSEAIATAAEEFNNQVEIIVKNFDDAWGDMSFDAMAEKYDRMNTAAERYVGTNEKIYNLNKLNRELEGKLEKTNLSDTARKKLLNAQQQLNSLYANNVELTSDELSLKEKELKILYAEIALEEARNAKSTMRLSRDAEGNYGYVYTANEENVASAEQNYEDAVWDYQSAGEEIIKKNQDAWFQIVTEWKDAISQLDTADPYYEQKLAEINKFYEEQSNYYLTELNDTVKEYARIAKETDTANQTTIKSYTDLLISELTDSDSALETHQKFQVGIVTAASEMKSAYKNWQDTVKGACEQAGVHLDTFLKEKGGWREKFSKALGEEGVAGQFNSLKEAATEDLKAIKKLFVGENGTGGLVKDVKKASDEAYWNLANDKNPISLLTALEKAGNQIELLQEDLKNLQDKINALTGNEIEIEIKYKYTTEGKPPTEVTDPGLGDDKIDGPPKIEEEEKEEDTIPYDLHNQTKIRDVLLLTSENKKIDRGWKLVQISGHRYFTKDNLNYIPQLAVHGYSNGLIPEGEVADTFYYRSGNELKKIENSSYAFYDTGGYTGEWGPEAKLAALHEKEIVLNKQDTANLLEIVGIVRELTNSINGSIVDTLIGSGYGVKDRDNILQQQVQITAEFPNAVDHDEIAAAFTDIINLASQYAGRG